MKIRHSVYSLLAGVALLAACDSIAERDRLIEVPSVSVTRSVLVEEFSGQYCTNCPYGAAQLHQLQQQYGADTLVVVTIHCGVDEGFGADPAEDDEDFKSLVTGMGEERYKQVGSPSQPSLLVDRRGGVVIRDDVGSHPENASSKWLTAILDAFKLPPVLRLGATATCQPADSTITVDVLALTEADANARLSVWVTEDHITAFQKFSDHYDFAYEHNNILRASATPLDGDAVTFRGHKTARFAYRIPVDSRWNVANLSIVAFVTDNSGVCQTVRVPVKVRR